MRMLMKLFVSACLLMIVSTGLHAEVLIFKWKNTGYEILCENGQAPNGNQIKVKESGFVIFDYDGELDEIDSAKLVKCWRDAGTKACKYDEEDFLGGAFNYVRTKTDKGEIVELSNIGENYIGTIKKGLMTKDKNQYNFPKSFKGTTTYKKIYEDDKISVGETKLRMTFDVNTTYLANLSVEDNEKGLSRDKYQSVLFKGKACEYEDLTDSRSYYLEMLNNYSGLFSWLGVGKDDEIAYEFPTVDGEANQVLATDGAGKLYWMGVASRDSYLLDRSNHTGKQSCSTLSDFFENVKSLMTDPEIVNEITNNIDMEEFLKILEEYTRNNDTTFKSIIEENTNWSALIKKLTSLDVENLKMALGVENFTLTNDKIVTALGYTPVSNATTINGKALSGKVQLTAADITGLSNYKDLKNNQAETDPTAADDETKGYSKMSEWLNTAASRYWICVSAAQGAAVWIRIDNTAGGGINASDISDFSTNVTNNAAVVLNTAKRTYPVAHETAVAHIYSTLNAANRDIDIPAMETSVLTLGAKCAKLDYITIDMTKSIVNLNEMDNDIDTINSKIGDLQPGEMDKIQKKLNALWETVNLGQVVNRANLVANGWPVE